jgi:hypothetical protein
MVPFYNTQEYFNGTIRCYETLWNKTDKYLKLGIIINWRAEVN